MKNLIENITEITDSDEHIWLFPAENKQLQFNEIIKQSQDFAAKLLMLGISRQQRIGLVMGNCSDYPALLLAIWRINAVAVPLRPRGSKFTQTDKHLEFCDQVCNFSLIIYDESMTKEAFTDWMDGTEKKALSLNDFISQQPVTTDFTHVKTAPDDIAILQFSSGSTGRPKGVIVTHAMMMAQLKNIAENHTASRHGTAPESMASWMPVHHDLGLFIGILAPMYSRCDNLLAPPGFYMRNPARWFSLLSDYQVDFTFTTNSALATTFNTITRLQRNKDIDLSQLHIYIAAEKVSPITVRRSWEVFSDLGLPREQIHIGYGMAENTLGCVCTKTPLVTINSFILTETKALVPVKPGTTGAFELVALGHADKHHDITVRDENCNILPELRLGEIYIKSPCVSPGYFNNPTQSLVSFPDCFFRSGDLGFYYQGELYFYARQDDMVIIGGRNIIPNDIEECAESLDFIRPTTTCLISGENTVTGVQELILLVEGNIRSNSEIIKERSLLTQKLVMNHLDILLKKVLFCPKGTIEKTSSGKKRRKVIRDRFLNQQLQMLGAKHV